MSDAGWKCSCGQRGDTERQAIAHIKTHPKGGTQVITWRDVPTGFRQALIARELTRRDA